MNSSDKKSSVLDVGGKPQWVRTENPIHIWAPVWGGIRTGVHLGERQEKKPLNRPNVGRLACKSYQEYMEKYVMLNWLWDNSVFCFYSQKLIVMGTEY